MWWSIHKSYWCVPAKLINRLHEYSSLDLAFLTKCEKNTAETPSTRFILEHIPLILRESSRIVV